MVRIINYKTRQKEDGTTFCVLEVQGGIEMVLSKETGQYYATAKKATLSTTFDKETCEALIGAQIAGKVIKISTEPFQYTIRESGDVITLEHKYIYVPDGVESSEVKLAKQLEEAFS